MWFALPFGAGCLLCQYLLSQELRPWTAVGALALGADACVLARPYVTAVYGGGAEGVKVLTGRIKAELEDTMAMCGVHSLSEISRDMVF